MENQKFKLSHKVPINKIRSTKLGGLPVAPPKVLNNLPRAAWRLHHNIPFELITVKNPCRGHYKILDKIITKNKLTKIYSIKKIKSFNDSNQWLRNSINESLRVEGGPPPLVKTIQGTVIAALTGWPGLVLWCGFNVLEEIVLSAAEQHIQVREGDEVLLFELLCREKGSSWNPFDKAWELKHISYYILVDTIRKDYFWILHEERRDVVE